jgi:hypothetical protein
MIAARTALPESSLRLSYGDIILNDPEATLEGLDITNDTTLSCPLLEAETLSTNSSHGIESSDNAVTEHRGIFRAEEPPRSGEDSWSTQLSTQTTESQQELSLYPFWGPKFGSQRILQILVLDVLRQTWQACRKEDIKGTVRPYESGNEQILTSEQGPQIHHLWHIRLPPPDLYADIIHLSYQRRFTGDGYQHKPFLIASKRRFQPALDPSYKFLCTLRLDKFGYGTRILRILGRLNELYIIRSQTLSNESERHTDYQILFSSEIRSLPRLGATRS